jgi:multiple sugar transport system substrate-binding protein
MSQTDDPRAAYCPFAYGYSNYSRPRYARYVLQAGGLVTYHNRRLRSTLGGAGIAVSAQTRHARAAMDFAQFAASPEVQKGIYFQAGGQPGHRGAWLDDAVNAASSNFFRDTLPTLDEALLRPQFPGYMAFQDAGSPVAHQCVAGKTKPIEAARELNRLYRAALANQA